VSAGARSQRLPVSVTGPQFGLREPFLFPPSTDWPSRSIHSARALGPSTVSYSCKVWCALAGPCRRLVNRGSELAAWPQVLPLGL